VSRRSRRRSRGNRCRTAGHVFAGAFAERIRPKPVLSVSEWADQHRVLSTKASSEPGPWRTSRVPYAREIMDALSVNSVAEEVIFVASVQVTKTEILLNFIGYNIDYNPSPSMVVLPDPRGSGALVEAAPGADDRRDPRCSPRSWARSARAMDRTRCC
jgi:phage terminase large subunit GpA-like protein